METLIRFLVGPRLYLRPVEPSDLSRCQQWINNPECWRTLGVVRPVDSKSEQQWWEGHDRSPVAPRKMDFAIVLHEGDRHIGNTGFVKIDWINRCAETGTLVGEIDCWGQGYATEAKRLLLTYAFDTLGLHRIESQTLEFNEGSARHLLKNGFTEEGRRRKAVFREGRWHDMRTFGLLVDEWREHQGQ